MGDSAKIQRLSAEIANQIAAGEVVERPASVVKELIENAVDAGATRVRVEIEEGGVARIAVIDDGDGMTPDDARMSLERHATSKLRAFEDLTAIRTFGFRGEALPSIASVSRLTLSTRAAGTDEATEVSMLAGGALRVRPAARSEGTTVEVRELFYNVPARRKFLKSTATESAHVTDVVLWAALARPDIAFSLVRDGKLVREHLRAKTRRERAALALPDVPLSACAGERGPLRVEAFLSAPEKARSGAVALYVLVNGRPVRDRQLSRAVAQAYGSVLEAGRFPVGVVYLDLPPELVDVNVHPQKAEVRFQDARAVFDAITRELAEGLSRALDRPAGAPPLRPWSRQEPARSEAEATRPVGGASEPHAWPTLPVPEPHRVREPVFLPRPAPRDPSPMPAPAAPQPHLFDEPSGFYASLRVLAQARGTYLVCEGRDGLYLLDQHAAAERVTFDALRRAHAAKAVASQRLLVAEIVALAPAEVALFADHEADVARLGLDIRASGASAVAVHAVPQLLSRAAPERLVRDVLAELSRSAVRPFSGASDLVLATMACHGSVRAGDTMSLEAAHALLVALDAVDFSGHCPHGRPVVMRLAFSELERKVGR